MNAEFTVAVHGMVYLLHKGAVTSSEELSRNICTNPARVRKVMAKLHAAGLVESGSGRGSGYHLVPGGEKISLLSVLDALEEECLSVSWHSGSEEQKCLIASGMGEVMDEIYRNLNAACREKLAGITIGQIERYIFRGKSERGPCWG